MLGPAEAPLRAALPPDPVDIEADSRALKQIALNLLSNAVKLTPRGGLVTVTMQVQGEMMELVVADSGVGIAPEDLKRIGRPFEQVESLLTKTHQGSGLGLAIAKSLTELHGGAMRIRSTLDKGTTVVLRFPRVQA